MTRRGGVSGRRARVAGEWPAWLGGLGRPVAERPGVAKVFARFGPDLCKKLSHAGAVSG